MIMGIDGVVFVGALVLIVCIIGMLAFGEEMLP